MKKLAVIGATGLLGQPVTNELLDAGYELSILTRNAEKAAKIWGNRVKIVEGDLQNPATLTSLLKDKEGLYVNLSVTPSSSKKDFQPEREGLQHILSAAKQAGIRRIGYVSSLVQLYQGMNGFNWWIFELKNQAVATIRNSGIPYTIFYPSTFMDNFDRGSYRQGKRILLAGQSLQPMYFIASNDFGKQVTVAFHNDSNDNKDYSIQGLETFTADDAAKVFIDNYYKTKLSIIKAPVGIMRMFSPFSRYIHYGVHIVEALNNYPETFSAAETWAELGKPTLTLSAYAKQAI